MFTYKFKGLKREDASTPYYYGSLPAVPKVGHILRLDETGNRYRVDRVVGEGLKGKGGNADQEKLAWADIGRGEKVPTLYLSEVEETKKFRILGKGKVVGEEKVKAHRQVNFSKKPEGKPQVIVREIPVDGDSWDEARLLKARSRANKKRRLQKLHKD
jgi:hypothetical protein